MFGFEYVNVLCLFCYIYFLKEIMCYSKFYFKRLNCKLYFDYLLIKL